MAPHHCLQHRGLYVVVVAFLIVAWVGVPPGSVRGQALPDAPTREEVPASAKPRETRTRGRVPCEEVISRLNHEVSVLKGRPVSIPALAKRLGTTKVWTAHCMLAYGRRVPARMLVEDGEDELEKFEDQEAEETGPEDVEEPGAREQPEGRAENPQDRREEHVDNPLKPAHEKEQVLRLRPEESGDRTFKDLEK